MRGWESALRKTDVLGEQGLRNLRRGNGNQPRDMDSDSLIAHHKLRHIQMTTLVRQHRYGMPGPGDVRPVSFP